jgi:hypothetical protein
VTYDIQKSQKRYKESLKEYDKDSINQLLGNVLWSTIKEIQRIIYKEIGKKFINSTPIYISLERFQEELIRLIKLLRNHYARRS